MRPWLLFAAAALSLVGSNLQGKARSQVTQDSMEFQGRRREYALFLPDARQASTPMPLIVLLHGSGGNGRSLVEAWRSLASAEGVVLVGPTAREPREWTVPQDGPRFLYDLVERIKAQQPIDPRRIYLFGHSAGGVFALYMGVAEGNFFAAAAAHAAALGGETSTWFSRDSRRLPLLIIAGTQDPVFPRDRVQATVGALEAQGFPVTLISQVGRGHSYEPGAKEINGAAWNFLKQHRLEAQPLYVPYEFERGAESR